MANDAISVRAEGVNEVVDRMVVLTKIHAHYTIRLPAGRGARQGGPRVGDACGQVPDGAEPEGRGGGDLDGGCDGGVVGTG